MKKDTEHYKLGQGHAASGMPRYKFQDAYLQSLYDAGYDSSDPPPMVLKPKRRCVGCGNLLKPDEGPRYCVHC